MARRFDIKIAALLVWWIFVGGCAGYGATTLALNLGLPSQLAFMVGSIVFFCSAMAMERSSSAMRHRE